MDRRDDTLAIARPREPQLIPPEGVVAAQTKTVHFAIQTLAVLAFICLRDIGGQGPLVHLAIDLIPLAQTVAYFLAAWWKPPRAQWTERERLSHFAATLRDAGYEVSRGSDGSGR